MPATKQNAGALDAYVGAVEKCEWRLRQIQDALNDLPAPDRYRTHWPQVEAIRAVEKKLLAVVRDLTARQIQE